MCGVPGTNSFSFEQCTARDDSKCVRLAPVFGTSSVSLGSRNPMMVNIPIDRGVLLECWRVGKTAREILESFFSSTGPRTGCCGNTLLKVLSQRLGVLTWN